MYDSETYTGKTISEPEGLIYTAVSRFGLCDAQICADKNLAVFILKRTTRDSGKQESRGKDFRYFTRDLRASTRESPAISRFLHAGVTSAQRKATTAR
jgi:hypothetical protein